MKRIIYAVKDSNLVKLVIHDNLYDESYVEFIHIRKLKSHDEAETLINNGYRKRKVYDYGFFIRQSVDYDGDVEKTIIALT